MLSVKFKTFPLLLLLFFVGCRDKESRENPYLSEIDLTAIGGNIPVELRLYKGGDEELFKRSFQQVYRYGAIFSLTNRDSELSTINSHAAENPLKISDEMFSILKESLKWGQKTESALDITVEPIVRLWGFNNQKDFRIPTDSEIDRALAFVGIENIVLNEEDQTLFFRKEGVRIDLGATAKGYITDRVVEKWREEGVESGLINVGGSNIYVLGKKPDGSPFKIGIQDPFKPRGEQFGYILGEDRAIITSGPYSRFFIGDDNVRYHHIFDSKSGRPVQNELESVTIVSNNSLVGDSLSTALFSMGVEKALAFVESIEETEALLVTSEREIYLTPGVKQHFSLTSDAFSVNEEASSSHIAP